MAVNVASLQATLRLVTNEWEAGLRRAAVGVDDFGRKVKTKAGEGASGFDELTNAIRRNEAQLQRLGVTAIATGAAISAGVGLAIATFDKFEKSIASAVAAAGGGRAEMEAFASSARSLAAELGRGGVTAQGTAEALVSIAQAGLKGNDALNVLRPSLILAAGNQENFAKMSEVTVAVLTQYGLKTTDAARVTNVLAAANANALGGVGAFSEALRIVGPTANQMGESVEATAAALALLIKTGMDASTAGTSLRQMFLQLASPTNEAREALAVYGITAQDVNPQTKDLAQIVDLLAKKQIDAGTAAKIFGDRSATAYTVLAQAGITGFTAMQQTITGTTAAQDQYRVMAERTGSALTELRNQVDLLAISMGERFAKATQGSTESLTKLLKIVDQLPESTKKAAAEAIVLAGAFTTVTGAGALLVAQLPKILGALALMARVAGPVGIALLVINGAIEASKDLLKIWNDISSSGTDRLAMLVQRQAELAKMLDDVRARGAVNPGEVAALEGQIAETRKEIESLTASLRAAATAKMALMGGDDPGLFAPPIASGVVSGKKPAGAVVNVEALTAMKKGLDEVGDKLRALSDEALRARLLPEEAEIAAKVDPIVRALDQLRQRLRDLGASKSLLTAFDAAAEAMVKNAGSSARAAQINANAVAVETAAREQAIAVLKEDTDARVKYEEMLTRGNDHLREMSILIRQVEEDETREGDVAASVSRARTDLLRVTGEETDRLKQQLRELQEQSRLAGGAMDAQAVSVQVLGRNFDSLAPEVQEAIQRIAALRKEVADTAGANRFAEDLAKISRQAQLLGPDFDALAANLEAVKRRMLEVAEATGGKLTPELVDLKTKFDQLTDIAKTRDLFRDLFGAIQGGIEQVIRGLQQGTLSWKSFGDVARQVIFSIAADLVNRLLKQSLNPVIDALANALAGTSVLSGVGGGAGSATGPAGSAPGSVATTIGPGGSFLSNAQTAVGLANSAPGFVAGFSGLGANWSAGTSLWGSASNALFGQAAVTGELGLGTAGTTGLFGSGGSLGGASSAFGTVLAGVGAGLAAFTNLLDLANGNLQRFGLRLAGGVAGGVIGGALSMGDPMAIMIGIVIGDMLGGFIDDLIGSGPSDEWLSFGTRLQGTLEGTQQAILDLQTHIGDSDTLADLAQSIADFRQQVQDAGVGGFVQATAGLGAFTVPGVPGATGTDHEGGLVANFQPWIDQINEVIRKALDAFRGQITSLGESAKGILPTALYEQFLAGPIAQLQARFNELIASGKTLDELKPDLEAFEATMAAVAQAVVLYSQISDQIAAASGNLDAMTASAIAGVQNARAAADQAIQDARSRLAEAITGPEIVAAQQQLQLAILAKFDLERKLVAQVESAIAGLLSGPGAAIVGLLTQVAGFRLQQGDTSAAARLLGTLEQVGASSNSAALKLWALNTALQAIVNLTPSAVAGAGGTITSPGQITAGVFTAASPFLEQLGKLIIDSRDAGDLGGALDLLNQGAGAVTALANAAISGIEQWATAARAASQELQRLADVAQQRFQEAMQSFLAFAEQFVDTATTASTMLLAGGDPRALFSFLAAMQEVQGSAQSAEVRLWAFSQAIDAIAASVSAAVQSGAFANSDDPGGIWQSVLAASAPFVTGLINQLNAAVANSDWTTALNVLNLAAGAAQQLANAAIAGIREWEQAAVAAAETAGAATEAAIQKEADAKIKANDDQLESLRAQRTVLEESLQLSRQWAAAVESIQRTLDQLRPGNLAPPNAHEQFAAAMATFQRLLAASATDPAAAGQLGAAGQNVLQTALNTGLMTLPSPEYRTLFALITDQLEDVMGAAKSLITPEEQAALSLESIDDQMRDLQDTNEQIRASAADAIADARANTASTVSAIHAAADKSVNAIKGDLATSLANIAIQQGIALGHVKESVDLAAKQAADAQAAAVASAISLATIERLARDEINLIRANLAIVLGDFAGTQASLLGSLVDSQLNILNGITGGRSVAQFTLDQQVEEVRLLGLLQADIAKLVASIPGLATGTDYTQPGLHMLHRGEAVLNQPTAEWWRRSSFATPSGGYAPTATMPTAAARQGGPLLVVHVDARGATDPAATKAMVREGVIEALKHGEARELVKKIAVYA